MNQKIKRLYERADKLGMKPFMFDQCITQHDVFDRKNNKIVKLNQGRYLTAARTILKEYKNV